MQDKKIAQLKGILEGNEDLAAKVLNWAEQTEKEADKAGVSFKEFFTGLFKREDKPDPDVSAKDKGQPGEFVGDLSPAAFKELQETTIKELLAPLAADFKALGDTQAAFNDGQTALKEAQDNIVARLKSIDDRVKDLEGETPRSQQGYRPSQDDETVVKETSTVKDAGPHVDPAFLDHFLSRQGQGQ